MYKECTQKRFCCVMWFIRNDRIVKAVNFTRWTCSKEGKNYFFGRLLFVFWIKKAYLEEVKTITGKYNTKQFAANWWKNGPFLLWQKFVHIGYSETGLITIRIAILSTLFTTLTERLLNFKFQVIFKYISDSAVWIVTI